MSGGVSTLDLMLVFGYWRCWSLLCALISCLCLGRVVKSGGAGLYSVLGRFVKSDCAGLYSVP